MLAAAVYGFHVSWNLSLSTDAAVAGRSGQLTPAEGGVLCGIRIREAWLEAFQQRRWLAQGAVTAGSPRREGKVLQVHSECQVGTDYF